MGEGRRKGGVVGRRERERKGGGCDVRKNREMEVGRERG